jgi:hypothetical protein
LDSFFVTVRIQATYTLEIQTDNREEAIFTAYETRVPAASLHDIEKDILKVVRMSRTPQTVTLAVEVDNTRKVR